MLEPMAVPAEQKGSIYLAETTSDVESQRDRLRRHLVQLGYQVHPKTELRLLHAREIDEFVVETIQKCHLTIHPVGGYYGFVPEGAEGKSVVQMQIELALRASPNEYLARIIWVPEGFVPKEDTQKEFLDKLRSEFAGHGFEFLESPFQTLASLVKDRLKTTLKVTQTAPNASGVYLVCDNADRALAKTLRSFLFNQGREVEWTPFSFGLADLTGHTQHERLLLRNGSHLVVHGETGDAWIQDRIRELNRLRGTSTQRVQAIYLGDPRRVDKDNILVKDILLVDGYSPRSVADALKPFLDQTS
jgi:hypothetical protein